MRPSLYVLVAAALLAGVIGYAFFTTVPGGVQAGTGPAPDVTLHTDQGDLPLSGARGRILVLYFSFPG